MKGCLVSFYFYHFLSVSVVFYANSADPDQTPRSAASDLGLHCLSMSPPGLNGLIFQNML